VVTAALFSDVAIAQVIRISEPPGSANTATVVSSDNYTLNGVYYTICSYNGGLACPTGYVDIGCGSKRNLSGTQVCDGGNAIQAFTISSYSGYASCPYTHDFGARSIICAKVCQ
jgi:hypothetical protein